MNEYRNKNQNPDSYVLRNQKPCADRYAIEKGVDDHADESGKTDNRILHLIVMGFFSEVQVRRERVLEHVDDLDGTYGAMRAWMKPGASMSHSIDFWCHNLTRDWNGHWTLGDRTWRVVRGTRRYLLNRQPLSAHVALLAKYQFLPVNVERHYASVSPSFRPAERFSRMSAEDRATRGVFLQAKTPAD